MENHNFRGAEVVALRMMNWIHTHPEVRRKVFFLLAEAGYDFQVHHNYCFFCDETPEKMICLSVPPSFQRGSNIQCEVCRLIFQKTLPESKIESKQ